MSARPKTSKTPRRTRKRARQSGRPQRTAQRCNPHWGKAFVTVSRFWRWPELERMGLTPPRTFSAGPGETPRERITVELGESIYPMTDGCPLSLAIKFYTPMHGWQEAGGPITVAQAHSLEEGLRAVFRAAREEGLLPGPVPNGTAAAPLGALTGGQD